MLSGVLSILSFPGAGLWPLTFISIVPLLIALEGTRPRRALVLGWIAGTAGNAGGFYWLVGTVQEFGNLPLPIAVLAYAALCIANGLGWGVFAWLMRVYPGVTPDGNRAPWWWAAVAFTAVEFGWWSVFPAYFGAGLYQVPALMQIAELIGVVGCSFLLVLLNAAWLESVRTRNWRPAAMAAAVLALWICHGLVRDRSVQATMRQSRSLRIGAVQTNIGAGTKRMGGVAVVRQYQEMTLAIEREQPDLILWPESAFPYGLVVGRDSPRAMTGPVHTPMVVGVVTQQPNGNEHNTAMLIDQDGVMRGQSHKVQMVPFGEYLPFGDRFPKLYDLIPAISHLRPGRGPEPLVLGDLRMGSLICYEDILPGFTRQVVLATRPQLIVNLTNDSWYGDSTEPTIHLALATFRAVEHRRSLVRATNTGISALIDPTGRIIRRTAQHKAEMMLGSLPLLETSPTIFTRFGDWLGWLCLAGIGGSLFRRWRNRKN